MRKIIICIITGSMVLGVLTACTKYLDTCERYVIGSAFCALLDKNDSRHLYSSVVVPREFIDAVDFGRGHDSLYGNPSYWYDEGNASFGNRGFRHHGHTCEWNPRHRYTRHNRHGGYRDYEFSISERYAPLMVPNVE